ncbi:calcium/sodium antiporter [Spongorhabdus nitratireducens]
MSEMLLPLLALIGGFVVLGYSADRLIVTASTLAWHLGMSTLLIGMTIVSFGTSAPELLVSAVASLNGAEGLSVGNAIGSNIVNMGLVLGICGLVAPLRISRRFLTHELPVLTVVMLLAGYLMMDGLLDGFEGGVLITALVGYCIYLVKGDRPADDNDDEDVEILEVSKGRALIESAVLLILMLVSSRLMVWGGIELARGFGIDELIIGLTVIAFGTSLPELAAAVAAVRRGMHDMALATVVGSNIFNLLGVLAFPGLIGNGIAISDDVLNRDIPAMILLSAILLLSAYSGMRRKVLEAESGDHILAETVVARWKSLLLFGAFVIYMGWLAMTFQ